MSTHNIITLFDQGQGCYYLGFPRTFNTGITTKVIWSFKIKQSYSTVIARVE